MALIATYEKRSVLSSTNYSKSVLRVVAEMVRAEFDWVDYFPSFEIVTGNHSRGAYFDDDLREVNPLGVAHVMRCFLNNLTDAAQIYAADPAPFDAPSLLGRDIICDEEMIEAVRGGQDAGVHIPIPPPARSRLQRWTGWVQRRLPWRRVRR